MEELITAIEENNLLKAKVAIKNGADLNGFIEIGEDEEIKLLFFAIRERAEVDIIKFLVESGADVEYINESGVCVLDEAVIYGDKELIVYLINELGFDINSTKRKSGMTPFIQSCCYGNIELAKFMYDMGADIYQKDSTGMDALEYAKRLGHKKMQTYLEELKKQ